MLKIESWPPTIENTSLAEATIQMIKRAKAGDDRYSLRQIAKDCGVFLVTHTDAQTAHEIASSLAHDERLPESEEGPFVAMAFTGIELKLQLDREIAERGQPA